MDMAGKQMKHILSQLSMMYPDFRFIFDRLSHGDSGDTKEKQVLLEKYT